MPMKGQEKQDKERAPRLIALLSFAWIILFSLVPLLLFLDREPVILPDEKDLISLADPFPLQGAGAGDFAVIGSSLARIEDQGLALLDAAGREQSFTSFPYRKARIIRLEDFLLAAPDQGTGLFLVESNGSSLEMDTLQTVQGADCRPGLLLTLGPATSGKASLMLYDYQAGSYGASLTLAGGQWPLSVSFVPGRDAFDLLLLDLSQGQASSRLLRFDLEGGLLFDLLIAADEVLPRLVYLSSDRLILYNDRSLILFEAGQGPLAREAIDGDLLDIQAREGRLVLMTREEGTRVLDLLLTDRAGQALSLIRPREGEGLDHMALATDGSVLLACRPGELLLFDPAEGSLIARQALEETVTGLLALDSQHFLIVFGDQAALASIK